MCALVTRKPLPEYSFVYPSGLCTHQRAARVVASPARTVREPPGGEDCVGLGVRAIFAVAWEFVDGHRGNGRHRSVAASRPAGEIGGHSAGFSELPTEQDHAEDDADETGDGEEERGNRHAEIPLRLGITGET